MPTLQQVIDVRDQKAGVHSPAVTPGKMYQRQKSGTLRNASGQKKSSLCGNATRW
jgi:hypothetical protein